MGPNPFFARAAGGRRRLPSTVRMNRLVPLRLVWPSLLLSGLLLTVGVVSAWNLHRFQARASRALDERVTAFRAAEELEITIRELRTQLNLYLLTGDRSYLGRVPELVGAIEQLFAEVKR